MSELRKNPFTDEWTLCAQNRRDRPYEFIHKTEVIPDSGKNCPFCCGHEEWTTQAVYQDGENDQWQIRVFPNKFPAVSNVCSSVEIDPFYTCVAGTGGHEVLVDTPHHNATIDGFSQEQLARILDVLQDRHERMEESDDTKYVQIFKNCGPSAGMSIHHSHWQVVGLPIVPERVEKIARTIKSDDCLFCKLVAHERKVKERMVAENDEFIAITPYASRFPYEVWLVPKVHTKSFGALSEGQKQDLAKMLKWILGRVIQIKEGIGYNICLMDAPKGEDFHWYLEVLPRLGGFAGFEFATNSYINPVLPEDAAKFYCRENYEG